MSTSKLRPAEKDEVYYWDTVRFLVDGVVFKLPRYQFYAGSEYFAQTYLQDNVPGSCPTPPLDGPDEDWDSMDVTDVPRLRISSAGAVELEGVTAAEFRVFLKLLFPIHSTSTTLNLSKAEWLTVLSLSTRWHFLEFRKLAISHLDPEMTDAVEMITVGRREFVKKWVEEGYEKLVRKEEAIGEEESERIGWKTAVRLYIVRHELSTQGAQGVGVDLRAVVNGSVWHKRCGDRVRERFADELCEIAGEERRRRSRADVLKEEEEDARERMRPDAEERKRLKKEAKRKAKTAGAATGRERENEAGPSRAVEFQPESASDIISSPSHPGPGEETNDGSAREDRHENTDRRATMVRGERGHAES